MCTVTIVPWTDGYRLVCNRDEARTRPPALPPRIVEAGSVRAMMPIDLESGGTWLAATARGLGFAVLNLNAHPSAGLTGTLSRGTIIASLLTCGTVEEAVQVLLQRRVLADYRPFRLVVASATSVAEVRQSPLRVTMSRLAGPLLFTSSSLGDHLVERPRRALFDALMSGDGNLVERQDRFHAHRWPSRPHLSVNMERDEASTVSRTVLEVGGQRVHMEYTAAGQNARTAVIYRFQSNR